MSDQHVVWACTCMRQHTGNRFRVRFPAMWHMFPQFQDVKGVILTACNVNAITLLHMAVAGYIYIPDREAKAIPFNICL